MQCTEIPEVFSHTYHIYLETLVQALPNPYLAQSGAIYLTHTHYASNVEIAVVSSISQFISGGSWTAICFSCYVAQFFRCMFENSLQCWIPSKSLRLVFAHFLNYLNLSNSRSLLSFGYHIPVCEFQWSWSAPISIHGPFSGKCGKGNISSIIRSSWD